MFNQNLRVTSWHPISHSWLFVLHPRYLWIPSTSHLFHFEPILTGLPGFGCVQSVTHLPILKQDAMFVHLFHLGKEMPIGTPVHPQGANHALSCSDMQSQPSPFQSAASSWPAARDVADFQSHITSAFRDGFCHGCKLGSFESRP